MVFQLEPGVQNLIHFSYFHLHQEVIIIAVILLVFNTLINTVTGLMATVDKILYFSIFLV